MATSAMTDLARAVGADDPDGRRDRIVADLVAAFADLMTADPDAFRTKFRKMAADPFAFYRGSACVFYRDVAGLADPWVDDRSSRVWIHGDLHAENFGTYMDGSGVLVFDVNDFDEAYLGHYTWDLQRLAASIALMGWQKALSDDDIDALVRGLAAAYLDQVQAFAAGRAEESYSLRLATTEGAVQAALLDARLRRRSNLLDRLCETVGYERRLRDMPGVRRLEPDERARACAAFERYLETIPEDKRLPRIAYEVKDIVSRTGFGIGSAGLPSYTVLIEGPNQALDNDIVLSMKQANVAAPSRVVDPDGLNPYFHHHGHRTVISQRALQAHADPLLGYTDLDGVGYVVTELSPYESDLDWSELTEPVEIAPVLDYLGRATAKMHCVADADSDHDLVPFRVEEAVAAGIGSDAAGFADWLAGFAAEYATLARADHARFVDAFRGGQIPGVRPTRG